MRLQAIIGNDVAARPVMDTAAAVGSRFGWDVEAIHVREDAGHAARAAAEACGVALRELDGDLVAAVEAAATASDVSALVVGARALPGAGPALGHVPAALATRTHKPLIVCAPDCRTPVRLERMLIPLDGSDASATALHDGLLLLAAADVEAIVLHVPFGDAIPPFDDHGGHETDTWALEFLRRHATVPGARVRLVLEPGDPSEAILRVAEREGADMIGLGWRQQRGAGRARVVERVLTHARVPVALYPVPTTASTSSASSVSTT